MKLYPVVLGLFASTVMAQSLDVGQVGGPSVSGNVHIAGLRVEKTFRDAAINTPLGLFAIERLYSTTAAPGWNRNRWFNSPYWSSSLSSVAIWTHELPYGLPSDLHDASKSITITTPHGDKFNTGELNDLPATAYTLPTTGDYRIIFKNDVVTLISDGVVFKYEFAEEPPASTGTPSVVKRYYRLRSVSPDTAGSLENCLIHYNLTAPNPLDVVGKATDVTCTGGSKIDIVWSAGLDRVEKLVLSARNGGVRDVMSYVYDGTGNLLLAIKDGSDVERYEYDTGFRVRRTSLMPNLSNTGYRTVSDDVLSTQMSCNDPFGWTSFSGVGLEADPQGQRNYVQEVLPGACPSTTKTTVSYTTAAGEQVATTYHTQNLPSNYTFRVDTKCEVGGDECAAVQNSTEWWEIQQPTPLIASAYTHVAIDARANGLNWSVSGQSWLTPRGAEVRFNQVDGRNCCTPGGGGSGVDQTSFGWGYFEARGAHEPLLTVEQKPSAASPGATMEIVKRFDPVTKNLRSTIVHGWTLSMDEDGSFERALGVFFFESRTCTDNVADPLHRAVEIHGPCWVREVGSTDCDLEDPDEPTPISQIEYYPDEHNSPNAGRPKLKRVFTRTAGLMCNLSDGLVTQYLQYDAAGHVLREVDPSGTVTERTYLGDKLATETIDGLTTTYWYSPAQGGRLSGIGKPTGEWTVYCYRVGSDLQSCTTGTPSDELQWEARIAGVGPGGGWSILQKTEYQYEPLNGAIAGSGGGRLVGTKTTKGVESKNVGYTYDALGRLSGEFAKSSITGTLLHGTPKLYDLTGHMIAEGLAYNNTPASCGGWKNPSKECTRYFYDEVNRIESVMKTGGSNPFVVNYGYDPRGALNSVSQAPGGQFASYVVDDFDQVVRIKGHWNTGAKDGVRQSFDAAGRLRFKQTSTQATLGDRTVYKYDAAGRPVSAEAYGYVLWAHGYDGDTTSWANCPSNTSARLRGRRQWTDDSFGRTWYEYDSAGRVVAERRVRQGGTKCSATARDSSEDTPDTTFEFRSDGRLYRMKYPHGLELEYEWGEEGRQDEIVAITHNDNGLGWKDLVANITYDVQGAIRSYEMGGDRQWAQENGRPSPIAARYLMHRRQPVPLGEEGCTVRTDVSSDGTVRPDTLVVTRPGESRDENVFLRRFSWQADQLTGQSTCVLDDEKPTNERFDYDEHLQLKSAQRMGDDLNGIGGAYAGLDYSYTNATDRDEMVSNGAFHHATYDGSRRLDGWVDEYVSKITHLDYDDDGRVNSLNEAVYATNFNLPARSISFEPHAGLDGVYRSVNVGGAIYEYFYDAMGRRRLKMSPDGNADEFFYSGDNLIEDRGVMHYGDEKRILSQYVWLNGMPIAVIKRPISTEGEVWPDDSVECYRNDQEDPCGLFYVVNDFLPKPVALINAAGRLAGVGEYNPFGAVNTVRIGEDARPWGVSHDFPYSGYAENDNRVIAMIHQPPRTGQQAVRARIRMSVVNSFNVDRAHIEDPSGASVASSIGGQYAGAVMSKWFPVDEPGVRVRWETDSSTPKPLIGVSVDSYEYRRYEASLDMPSWIPLRFPGQYFDEETGLHENRNRFYSPELGRYLSADPLDEGEHGLPLSNNAYAYANSNPVTMSDPLGLIVKNYNAMKDRLAKSQIALDLLKELNDNQEMTYEFIFAPPPTNYLGQNMSKDWGLTDGRNATEDKTEKLIKIYINSDKLNAGDPKIPGSESETTFEEVAAHEMSHATRWQPSWLIRGSEPEATPYDVQIKVRTEDLGLGINMRWINEQPTWETHDNGMHNTPRRNTVIQLIQKNGEWRP